MSTFDKSSIEGLIEKAKELRLTRLRVADGDGELCVEFPRSARALVAATDAPVAAAATARDVLSQFVGYFRPTAEPGTKVSKDSVVGVVESLGLPNDVTAPAAGTLGAFNVSEGDAVEYGTVVARIET